MPRRGEQRPVRGQLLLQPGDARGRRPVALISGAEELVELEGPRLRFAPSLGHVRLELDCGRMDAGVVPLKHGLELDIILLDPRAHGA